MRGAFNVRDYGSLEYDGNNAREYDNTKPIRVSDLTADKNRNEGREQ